MYFVTDAFLTKAFHEIDGRGFGRRRVSAGEVRGERRLEVRAVV